MGGKKATSTSQVTIPPEVLARYNAINARAETAASKPFQAFGSNPADYVAQMNEQQALGTSTVNKSGGPAYAGIDNYMTPYTKNVADTTGAYMRQQQEQAQSGALGTAASSGAFGGDRAGIAAANLQQQNQMAYGKTMADIMNQGYTQALGASQADLNRGLQAGQMQLAAGTMQQQTEQAGKDAMINRFMQEQGLPYQQAQFLANIALGTGAASGSTTTSTQPVGFFQNLATGGKVDGYAEGGGVAGPVSHSKEAIGGVGYVPEPNLPIGDLMIAQPPEQSQDSGGDKIAQILAMIGGGGKKDGGAIGSRHGYDLGGTPKPSTDNPEWVRQLFNSIPGTFASMSGYSGAGGAGLAAADAAAIAARERRAAAVPSDPYNDKILQVLKASGPTIPHQQVQDSITASIDEGSRASSNPFGAPFNNTPAPVAATPEAAPQGGVAPAPVAATQPQPRLSFGSTAGGISPATATPPMEMGSGVAGNAPQTPAVVQPEEKGVSGNIVQAPSVVQAPTKDAMADPFDYAVRFTLQSEGGYNPKDANGAPVNQGINQAYHPEVDVANITEAQARDIYRRDYWEPINGDALSAKDPQLARAVFDTAVMSGPGTANDLLAKSGGDTQTFLQLRANYLSGLIRNNPEKYGKYAKAWNTRTIGLGGPNMMTTFGEAGIGDPNSGGLAAGLFGNDKPYEDRNAVGKFFNRPEGGLDQNAILSLLSGLGTMASSRSVSPFSAILQGLGGGAETYKGLLKQNADVASTNIANMRNIQMDTMTYNELNGTNITPQQYASMIGANYQIPTGTAQPMGGDKMTWNDYQNGVVEIDGKTVNMQDDPVSIQKFISDNSMFPPESPIGQQVAAARVHLNDINNSGGMTVDKNGQQFQIPGYTQVGDVQARTVADQNAAADFRAAAGDALNSSAQQLAAVKTLESVYSKMEPGKFANVGAEASAILSALDPNNVTGWGKYDLTDPAQYEIAMKGAGEIMATRLRSMPGGAPSAEIDMLSTVTPTPNMQPEAVKKLLAITKADAQYRFDMYNNYDPAVHGNDVNAYMKQFADGGKTFTRYVEEAMASMPRFAGEGIEPTAAEAELLKRGYVRNSEGKLVKP